MKEPSKLKKWVVPVNNCALAVANLCLLVALGGFFGIVASPESSAAKSGFWYAVVVALIAGVAMAVCQWWLQKHFPNERRQMLGRAPSAER